MTTLTGFEDHHETPDAWRAYIARLQEQLDGLVQDNRRRKAKGRLSQGERYRFLCRYCVLSERIERARDGLESTISCDAQ